MNSKLMIFLIIFGLFFIFFFSIFVFDQFKQPIVLLSFDTESNVDSPQIMTDLLNILQKYNAKATFFVMGDFAKQNPEIIHRMISEGHEIACHTQNHQNLLFLNYTSQYDEINECKKYLDNEFDLNVTGFRSPYRAMSPSTFKVLRQTGFKYDASVFQNYGICYPFKFIDEIYTSSLFMIPLDDYNCLNILKLNKIIYFGLLEHNFKKYKSYSFHPRVIMEYAEDFDVLLYKLSQENSFLTHERYLDLRK